MSHLRNLTRIKAVYNALGDLQDHVVFVGGATVSLYSDQGASEVRPTDDIDVVVEILTHKDFAILDERLRAKGFKNDQSSGIICRYNIHGLIVDIMPTHDKPLGFSNPWYPMGFANAVIYEIDERHPIKIFNSTFFLASKLSAFEGRGKNDGRTSTDFEDIVYVLENRSLIWVELENCEKEVKQYLKNAFNSLLNNPFFEEWIDAHTSFGSPVATDFILQSLKNFVNQ